MQIQSQTRLWTRDFVLLVGSTLLLWSSFHFLLAVLPLYVVQRLGGTRAQVGLLMAAVGVLAIGSRLVSGWAADRWGRRPVQLFFIALFCAVTFSYDWASTFGLLLLVRFVHGLPFGGSTTAGQVVASDLVPAARRGEGIGYYIMAGTVAMATGPTLAFGILGDGGFGRVFVAAGLLAAGALLLAWFIRHPLVHDPMAKFSLAALFERRVLWVSVVGLFIALSYSGVTSFVTLYGQDLGVANAGVFFTVHAVGVVLIRSALGRVLDQRGPAWVMAAGLVALGLCCATLALWRTELGYLAGGLLFGLGYGASVPTVQTMAVNVVPPARRGAANATLFAFYDVGMSIGPYINGLVAESSGYAAMYLVGAASLLVPAVLFYGRVLPEYGRARIED